MIHVDAMISMSVGESLMPEKLCHAPSNREIRHVDTMLPRSRFSLFLPSKSLAVASSISWMPGIERSTPQISPSSR